MQNQTKVMLISSGVGKSYLQDIMCNKGNYQRLISGTTRSPRSGVA